MRRLLHFVNRNAQQRRAHRHIPNAQLRCANIVQGNDDKNLP
jgi:hypothetical protein